MDPAFAAYKAAADKILADYDLAMNDVATIDNNLIDLGGTQPRITPDTAVEQLERVFIPKLTAVAKQAADLSTPDYPTLTAAHRPLAVGLVGKVEAYRAMVSAYKARNAAEFDKGFQKLLASDKMVKGYRSYLQKWSEVGRITELPPDPSAPTAAPVASPVDPLAPPGGGGTPGGLPGLPPIPGAPTN